MQDFNDAEPQKEMNGGSAIPPDSVVQFLMTIRPASGNKKVGSHELLTQSKKGDSEGLDCEFVVNTGTYQGRKIWSWMTVNGNETAMKITKAMLRAILESARGIKPDDQSSAAVAARRVNDWAEFQNLLFMAKVGCEDSQDGKYVNNTLKLVITPDKPEYDQCAAMGEILSDKPVPKTRIEREGGTAAGTGGAPAWAKPAPAGAAPAAAAGPAPAASAAPGAPPVPAWAKPKA